MARGEDIEDFSEKAKLALGRANLSRGRTAQILGMDKSVISRWLSGAALPTSHSLAQLSALLTRHIDGFNLAEWYAPFPEFAKRLGLGSAAMEPQLVATEGRPGSHEAWLSEARTWAVRDGLDEAEDRFCGLWLLLWPNLNFEGEIGGIVGEIWRGPQDIEVRWRNGASGPHQLGRRGPAFATGHLLFTVNGAPLRNRTFGAVTFVGTERKTAIMDGVLTHPVGPRADRPSATRTLGLRLADAERNWDVGEQRFWAAGTLVEKFNKEGWDGRVPEVLRKGLLQSTSSLGVLIKPDESPFLLAEQDVLAHSSSPHQIALRDALLAIRALFPLTP